MRCLLLRCRLVLQVVLDPVQVGAGRRPTVAEGAGLGDLQQGAKLVAAQELRDMKHHGGAFIGLLPGPGKTMSGTTPGAARIRLSDSLGWAITAP